MSSNSTRSGGIPTACGSRAPPHQRKKQIAQESRMNPLQRILLTKLICRALATVLLLSCSLQIFSQPVYFEDVLAKRFFSDPEWTFEKFCPVSANIVARRVLEDYGSMFAAHESIVWGESVGWGGGR